MKRFHRAVSLTLLVLASLILVIELFRTGRLYLRILLASALTLFCIFGSAPISEARSAMIGLKRGIIEL